MPEFIDTSVTAALASLPSYVVQGKAKGANWELLMKYYIVWLLSIVAVPAFYGIAYRTESTAVNIIFCVLGSVALAMTSLSYRLIYRNKDYERGFHAGYNAGSCAEEVEK